MTHICEKIHLCYATAKILQRGGKTKALENARSEKLPPGKNSETADTSRPHKDAK